MGTKNSPGVFDCYHAAEPDEPMFVLLGRDPLAHMLVRIWADLRQGFDSPDKVNEARTCADALEAWARKKRGDAKVDEASREMSHAALRYVERCLRRYEKAVA